ncbi:MAG TPA: Crp/Fnr family transcriptional regulator [Geminicoccaceae bacterium]|nr:Crp/Fnr family transcriptional regulator [Geminicoccaceae bacterium]
MHGRIDRDVCAHCCARKWGFCAALHDEALKDLQRTTRRLSLASGQSVLLEGEPADHVFVVVSGLISTYKALPDGRRQIIGLGMPGDFSGALFEDCHCFSAEAVTRCEVCRIPIAELEKLCNGFPALERRLLKMLSDELCQAQAEMLVLGRKTAPERLASFLLMLRHRAEHRGEPANPIRMFLNRDEIADCLGLTSSTVSRTFTQLVRLGLIRLHRRRQVVLLRRDLLERLAEGKLGQLEG